MAVLGERVFVLGALFLFGVVCLFFVTSESHLGNRMSVEEINDSLGWPVGKSVVNFLD